MAGPSDGMNGNGNLPLHLQKRGAFFGRPLLALHSCVPPDFFSCPIFVVAWASSIHAVLLMTNGLMHRMAGPSDGMNGNGNQSVIENSVREPISSKSLIKAV